MNVTSSILRFGPFRSIRGSVLLAVVLAVMSLWGAASAQAQVELIVRLQDNAGGALAQALRPGGGATPMGRADTTVEALMRRVERVRPVFRPSPAAGSGAAVSGRRAAQPIPAYTLQLPDSAALRRTRRQLAGRADVAYTQPVRTYSILRAPERPVATPVADDPLIDSLRFYPVIRVPEAHEVTTGDASVRVGVVDTGIFFEHPDLEGQVWVNPGEDLDGDGVVEASDFNGVDDDGNGYVDDLHGYDFVDREGIVYTGDYVDRDSDPSHDRLDPASTSGNPHGTNVAGIISAAKGNGIGIAGVAPGVKLVPLRALSGDGNGTDDDIAAAIVYGADLGLDVLNFSFGDVYYSRLMEEAVQYAAARGVVMTASAGNQGSGDLQSEHYPSDYPEVISVAQLAVRIGLDDGLVLTIPGKYGTGLDLAAPGTQIFTTTLPRSLTGPEPEDPDPADFYTRLGGSSFAAPQVAGTAALLRSIDPDLSPEAIRAILTATAEDLEEEGWDQRTGAGLLDAGTAVRRALPARTQITYPESDGGIRADEIAVVGSSIDPSFRSFAVSYARGDSIGAGEDDLDFTQIGEPTRRQVLDDTLAVWNTGALAEGLYTLRLATRLQDGSTVEERRRVHVDRSAPRVRVRILDKGLVQDDVGVLADLQTDDLSTAEMQVRTPGGRVYTVESDRRARRHGLTWAASGSSGSTVDVTLRVTNVAGLTTTVERTLRLPPNRINTGLFAEETLDVPAGLLLPQATDFDADSLLEITFTEYRPFSTAYSDTVRTHEWDGDGFALSDTLVTNLRPADTGDTDRDGLQELLLRTGRATLLIEQPEAGGYPNFLNIAYADTTGLLDPDSTALSGGLLTDDLDGDGYGEIFGYDRDVWRVAEPQGDGVYRRVASLRNPTPDSLDREREYGSSLNDFSIGRAVSGDFDGDGRGDFVATDTGGDFVLWEAKGDDRYEPVWTYTTPRFAGRGRRIAAGDFDGDGIDEFVTYTRPFPGVNLDVEREPQLGRYYLWDAVGDDRYRLADTLSVAGVDERGSGLGSDGAMAAVDLDGDGRDELAVVDPPALLVFRYDAAAGGLVPIFREAIDDPPTQDAPSSDAFVSPVLVAADFNQDGAPDLVTASADGQMHLLTYRMSGAVAPAPRWVQAAALSEQQTRLEWRASGADSVTVFRGPPGGAFDRLAAVTDDSTYVDEFADGRAGAYRYALRAHYGAGRTSPLSEERLVQPLAAPRLVKVTYASPQITRLRFSRQLARDLRTEQFTFDEEDGPARSPVGLAYGNDGETVILRFEGTAGTRGTLRWEDLNTRDGVPIPQASTTLVFPAASDATLIISSWDILGPGRVAITFSAPLAPASARDASNYTITAPGVVTGVTYDESSPQRVVVQIDEVRIGPTGRENALTVEAMRSRDGRTLASEGNVIRLSEAAEDLTNVYVYPNPYHAGRHSSQRITVAGLPAEAMVRVLSMQGSLVRTLDERGSDGGLDWDLTDRSGDVVPAGVYLLRIEAPDSEPILKKAAVIR